VTPRKMDLTWKGGCMCSLFIGCHSDFFECGHLKENVYTVPARTIKDLVARLQASVTVVEGGWGGPLSLLFSGYWELFPHGQSTQGVRLTTHFHIVLRLRMM
jgi:hypothetical protein